MSKEKRAKILSIYSRPWTLARAQATADVPFLTDLALVPPTGEDKDKEPSFCIRSAWTGYIKSAFPHALQGARSFLLASLAEGRGNEEEDPSDKRQGPELVCKLSLAAVHKSISLKPQKSGADDETHTQ